MSFTNHTSRENLRIKRSVTVVMAVLVSMLYAVFCQAQILGTGQLGAARRSHTATLLRDGKILIVGGDNANGLVGQAEIFDPASFTSSNIVANPIALRTDHTATLLADGRVLIIGGVDTNGLLRSTEFYNPSSVPAPSFTTGPSLVRARSGHTATELANGKILIIGGESMGSAEIYDPATQSFSQVAGSLNTPRQYHSAVLLSSGKVLIVGGVVGANTTLASAEIYDPATQTFTLANGAMQTPRGLALLRVLPDGKVQVIGGDSEFSMEMFDPATDSFIALAHIPPHEDYLNNILASRTRSALITTIIQQNPVLQGQPELTAEIIALLNRLDHTVTEIPQSNRAVIAGGVNDAGQILGSATVVSSSAATITTDRFDYAPGEIVTITGQGWQPNETVWMLFHEEPETHDDVVISSLANNQGSFTNTDFAPAPNDLDRSFTLTAIGQSSGSTAQTTFKDAKPNTVSVAPSSVTVTPAVSASYTVTVNFNGNNNSCTSPLSVTTVLPTGASASFNPTSITSTGGNATSTLTITTTAATPTGSTLFTVLAGNGSGCQAGTATNTATLVVTNNPAPTTTSISPTSKIVGESGFTLTVNGTNFAPTSVVRFNGSNRTTTFVANTQLTVSIPATDLTSAGSFNITVVSPAPGGGTSNPQTFTVNPAGTTTLAANATTTFSTASQTVTLSSTVTANSPSPATVNQGTVTFTVKKGTTVIGVPVTSAAITAGNASANFTLPGGTAADTYTIEAAYSGGTNFNTSNDNTKTLTVQKSDQTITFGALADKTYGDPDFTISATASSGLAVSFSSLTTTTCTVSGNSVHIVAAGVCTIRGSQGGDSNYNAAPNVDQSFNINKKNATWTTSAASKTYGDADPIPLTTGSGSGFSVGDNVTATYSRVAGETVAGNPYHIIATLSPAGVLGNYNITNAGADFTINKKAASVTPNAASKIYGDTEPALSGTLSGFLVADGVTATYSRTAGETVAGNPYTISATLSPTSVLNNYDITYNTANFTINKRNATWTTSAASKTYGDADPVPLTTGNGSGFLAGDGVSATYARSAGEIVSGSPYHITATLSPAGVLGNYNITNAGADFTINKRNASVTATDASKIYGDVDPTLATTNSGFLAVDLGPAKITFSASRAAGENVSTYAITPSASDNGTGLLNNYNVTFNNGAFTVNKRPITITADAKNKIYGDADPALTYQITAGSLKSGDAIAGALTRAAGESVSAYAIGRGTLAITDGNNGNNYDLTFVGANLTINKRDASVTPNAASKVYGDADPALNGTLNGFLVADGVTASYSRTAGETVAGSPYTISATLSPASVLGNYNITYNTALFTINKKAASVTPNATSKVYGEPEPALSGTLSGFLVTDGVTATYSRTAGENVGTYTVSATLNPAGVLSNYDITYNTAIFTINKAGSSTVVTVANAIYDGNPHGGSALVTGVGGLNQALTVYYAGTGSTLYSTSIAAPINAGTYSASATFTGDANHDGSSDVKYFSINKAAASIILSGATTYIYDGNPKFASADTNPLGLSGVTITYNGSLTAPSNPGSYAVVAALSNPNYQAVDANGTLNIIARPIAYDQSVSTNEDAATAITLAASDSDSPTLTFSLVSGPSYGSLSGVLPNATYTPSTNYNGADGFTFKATDGDSLDSNVATVSITVNTVNDKPQAQAQSASTDEDVPVVITLRGRDIDSAALSFSVAAEPSNGLLGPISAPTCTQVPNPSATQGVSCTATVTYTPSANFNGADTFAFATNDGALDSVAVTVSITVNPVNDMPTANAQSVIANDMIPLPVTLTGSDVETAPVQLTFTIVTAPAHGALSGVPPNLLYTANSNYKGPDNFTFTVTDRGDPNDCGAPSASCADVKTSPAATVSITVTDGAEPNTLITDLKPATLSNDRNPKFGFNGTDNVTTDENLAFECGLDFGAFLPCGNAGDFTTQYMGLGDGPHTFQVRAKDQSNNTDQTPANYTWTIDATAPDSIIDSQPAALATSASASFTFHSTENNSTLACSLDGVTAVDCSGGSKAYLGLSDGPHTFTVAATDQAGNVDSTPANFSWTIDTTAPQTSINNQPSNPTTNTSASFAFSGSDPSGNTFECGLDGAPFAPCSSPKAYNGLALGNHSFAVRAKDSAGNMDTTPASYSWTIGAVTIDNYTMDTDFKRFDGFDVVFGKGTGSYLKIHSTNPESFHYQIKLTNNSGVPISPANGNTAAAIITVPGMPSSCGGVPCSSQIGSLSEPAFVLRGRKIAHVWPGHNDHDDDNDDDDMPVTLKYLTLAQFQANGNSCADNSSYSSTLPANGAPKCIKITGFSIPVKHAARIRLNFQFRLKGTDGWDANAQKLFYAGFVFRAATSVNFGANVQSASDSTGIIGAGNKATAIGGYGFNSLGAPLSGYAARVFNKASEASCSVNTKLVSQDVIDTNGFYYIWRTGTDQHSVAPNLPSGVQYAVQLCNGSSQLALQITDSRLREKEFEQVDFNP